MVTTPMPAASAEVHVEPTPSPSWGVDGRVFTIAIVGDTVIVGGTFANARGPSGQTVARRNLAAFDRTTGALLTDWRADTNGTVRNLKAYGSTVYAGGSFTRVDGLNRRRFARLDAATGAVDPGFAVNFNATVRAIAIDATWIYVGGMFTNVDGMVRNRLVRLSRSDGAVDPGFVASANDGVWGLVLHPTAPTIYASGRFTTIGGASRNGVAALDAESGAVRSVVFSGAALRTLALTLNADGTRLYGAGGGNNTMAAWSTTSGNRVWRIVAMGDIQAVAYFRDTVYFGFHEGIAGDTTAKVLAADATTGQLDPAFRPSVTTFMGVFAIAVNDAGLAIGGEFTRVAGVTAYHWAWFPASGSG